MIFLDIRVVILHISEVCTHFDLGLQSQRSHYSRLLLGAAGLDGGTLHGVY